MRKEDKTKCILIYKTWETDGHLEENDHVGDVRAE